MTRSITLPVLSRETRKENMEADGIGVPGGCVCWKRGRFCYNDHTFFNNHASGKIMKS